VRLIRRWFTVAGLVLGPLVLLVALRGAPSLDLQWFSPHWHLIVVSGIAACALVAAVVALVTAGRSGQPNVIWLGIGCVAVGLAMLGHGLTTPGVFDRPYNIWVSRLPYGAMCVFAVCLAVAGRPPTAGLNRLVNRHPIAAITLPTLAIGSVVGAVTFDPLTLSGAAAYAWEENAFDVVSITAIVLLAISIRTHWRRWHLGHDVFQFAVVLSATSCIAALVAFEHGRFGHVSWWDYHAYLMAGFGGAVYAVLRRRGDERTLTELLNGAFVDDPFVHIVSGYPEALRSLVRAVEVKDTYTHGHSQRTARLAVELGLSMGLAPDQLRVIARGAYLHDVGKIGIPDSILNKPDALTPEEWAVIKTHPQLGYELASAAPSLGEALPVILHHHERVDGLGYPGGLEGNAIPLEARVVAVADVWDALTSDRAYRKGWSPEMALAHIRDGAGTHFDPQVVEALVRVIGCRGITEHGDGGTATVAWQAAETCHEIDHDRLVSA
jgi:HD-GYP domain-containing protein (c-di-GMP phosphodiesterase class II)